MRAFFILLSCCFVTSLQAQDYFKVFVVQKNPGQVLYAANSAYCPVSVSLDLSLENMNFSSGEKRVFVIPARTDSFKLGELDIAETGKRYRYSYRYRFNYGDVTLKTYDRNYTYSLPFQKGKRFLLYQGYNGNFSHRGENALDFTMPEGTEVLAARDGVVIKVIQNNSGGCPEEECKKMNNSVMVYHTDGTLAVYVHIQYNGARVKEGDRIKTGDLIALSGNTGWSSGPHLHFSCSLPGIEKRETVPVLFRTGDGSKTEQLQEKNWYTKEY